VVSIEASPYIIPELERNLKLNAIENVRVVNVAVTDKDGEVEIYYGPINHSGLTSVLKQGGVRHGGTVRAKPLPFVLTEDELTQCRLFKIDVEGAEWLVVKGLRDAIKRTRSDAEFVVEISPKRLSSIGQRPQDVIETFAEAGFNAYSILNSYSPSYYLSQPPYDPPRRLAGEITREVDIIFSRRDEFAL
jgi:FkbM family methyltransferase